MSKTPKKSCPETIANFITDDPDIFTEAPMGSPLGKVTIDQGRINAAQVALNNLRLALSPYDADPSVKTALNSLIQAMKKTGYTVRFPSLQRGPASRHAELEQ